MIAKERGRKTLGWLLRNLDRRHPGHHTGLAQQQRRSLFGGSAARRDAAKSRRQRRRGHAQSIRLDQINVPGSS